MYSQNDEEKWIVEFYRGFVGRFLDIGSHDGISLSCTRKLFELGWGGVCVDPSPTAFVKLLSTYNKESKIEIVNCAVDIDSRIKKFYHRPEARYISTLSKEFRESWKKEMKDTYQDMYLKTITFDELLSCFGYDFHFLKIDVEGIDFEILQTKLINFKLADFIRWPHIFNNF